MGCARLLNSLAVGKRAKEPKVRVLISIQSNALSQSSSAPGPQRESVTHTNSVRGARRGSGNESVHSLTAGQKIRVAVIDILSMKCL